jgi:CBS domain-containing protein
VPRETLVRTVMSSPVVTVGPDTSVDEAARLLAEHGFGALPVVAQDGVLVGLLRDDDLIVQDARLHMPTVINLLGGMIVWPGSLHRLDDEVRKVAASVVRDAMDDDPPTVRADDSLELVATLMHDRDVTHVPVVDGDGRLVGVIARGDLVRALASRA